MNMSDPIADMLTRIRNAGRESHPSVEMPSSKIKTAIAKILNQEGYIGDYQNEDKGDSKKDLRLKLKYIDGKPVIVGLERISLPSKRAYVGADSIPKILGGLGVVILSTPNGVISGKEASKAKVGGELLCKVW